MENISIEAFKISRSLRSVEMTSGFLQIWPWPSCKCRPVPIELELFFDETMQGMIKGGVAVEARPLKPDEQAGLVARFLAESLLN